MTTRTGFRIGILASLAIFALSVTASAASQWYFKHAAWVCATPEAYGSALESQRALNGRPFEELRRELYDKGQCVYIADGDITSVIAPYLTLVDTSDKMARVSFVIKYDKPIEYLKHDLNWMKFSGWTEVENLKELW